MENIGDLRLEVGQLAEMKTFDKGFRGAWFRCKIKDVLLEKNQILLEYYDFEEEEIAWTKIYEVPHYGRKSNQIKKQLILRPHYPLKYRKNEMPPVNSISEVCVIFDGTWKVGDLVDWFEDSSYWTARVIKVLSDDKVQIELPMSPAGEGGKHEAFCKDLRPSLDWSAENGWTLATMDGQISCSAQLIFPSQQDCMDSEREDASSTSRISAAIEIEGDRERQQEEAANKMINSEQVKMASSTSRISAAIEIEGDRERQQEEAANKMINSEQVKMASSSSEDSISTLHVEESNEQVVVDLAEYSSIELNVMHEETLEATILDLEELANRIKWIKTILETNQDATSSSHWMFT